MNIEPKNFKHNSSAISKEQFNQHIALYNNSVSKLNEVSKNLLDTAGRSDANQIYSYYRGLKKGEGYSLNSVILHEEYFNIMTDLDKPMGKKTIEMFNTHFTCIKDWRSDFHACAMACRGFAVLIYDQRTQSFKNILIDAHDVGNIVFSYPIIVLDCYEHSYFTDFGINKDKYITAFIDSINWSIVEKRICNL
jgi:superoxide dismutase, Fe-Mn family